MTLSHITKGLMASILLLMIYFGLMGTLSGQTEAINQFLEFKYFIMVLAFGFGLQITLYSYLRKLVVGRLSNKIVAASGTTSAFAMAACCTHYVVGILPIIGISGIVVLVAQYQVHLFWIGIAANFLGIGYMWRRIIKVKKHV